MATPIELEIARSAGGAEARQAGLISGLSGAARQFGGVVGGQLAEQAFQQKLNEGAEGLVSTAREVGLENPDFFKNFGDSREKLIMGWNMLLKKREAKEQRELQAELVSKAVQPVEEVVEEEVTDPDGEKRIVEAIRKRAPKPIEAIRQSPEAFTASNVLTALSKEGVQTRFDEALDQRQERMKSLEEQRGFRKRQQIFTNLGLKDFPKTASTFKSMNKQIDRVKPILEKIDNLNIPGVTSRTIFTLTPNALLQVARQNGLEKEVNALKSFSSSAQRFLADYIKSISGAQASDREVVRLTEGVSLGRFDTFGDFVREFNEMIDKHIDNMEIAERQSRRVAPTEFDKMFAEGLLPSAEMQRLKGFINNLSDSSNARAINKVNQDQQTDTQESVVTPARQKAREFLKKLRG